MSSYKESLKQYSNNPKVLFILVVIVTCIISFVLIMMGDVHTKTITVTVTDSVCTPHTEYNKFVCALKLRYTVDGTEYNGSLNKISKKVYNVGDTIVVKYNPNDPTDISVKDDKYGYIGHTLLRATSWLVCLAIVYIAIIKLCPNCLPEKFVLKN
jgi:hypothetical protein